MSELPVSKLNDGKIADAIPVICSELWLFHRIDATNRINGSSRGSSVSVSAANDFCWILKTSDKLSTLCLVAKLFCFPCTHDHDDELNPCNTYKSILSRFPLQLQLKICQFAVVWNSGQEHASCRSNRCSSQLCHAEMKVYFRESWDTFLK